VLVGFKTGKAQGMGLLSVSILRWRDNAFDCAKINIIIRSDGAESSAD